MRAAQGCKRFLEDLGDHLDGTLSGPAHLVFERHLQVCGSCQFLCATVEKTIYYYRTWDAGPIPADIEARLWKALESRMRSPRNSHA